VAAEPTAAQPAEAEPVAAQPAAAEPTAAQPAAAEINPEGNDEAAPATEEVAPTETVPTGEDSPAAEAAEPVSPLLVPAGEDRVPGTLETEEAPETLRFEGMLVALQSPPVARLQQSSFPGALWNYPESQGADSAGGETDYKEQDDDWTLIPGFGKNEQLKRALFSLTTETPVAEILFEGEDGRIQIVRLLERNEPSAEELATLTGEVSRLLLAHRQRNAYRAWYGALLNRAIEDEFLTFTEEWQLQIDTEMQNYQRQANRAAAL
jgi:hypothetical protein